MMLRQRTQQIQDARRWFARMEPGLCGAAVAQEFRSLLEAAEHVTVEATNLEAALDAAVGKLDRTTLPEAVVLCRVRAIIKDWQEGGVSFEGILGELELELPPHLRAPEPVAQAPRTEAATAPTTRMPGEEGRRREVAACTLSLAAAVQAAGGNVGMRDLSLLNLTLGEFICEIAAQNNIRFAYTGPRDAGA